MKKWIQVAPIEKFPVNAGACAFHAGQQIAIFNFDHSEWYAIQNRCPHQGQMVLSRGLLGETAGQAKVACPLHKNSFYLRNGQHTGGREDFRLVTYPVRVEDGAVWIEVDEGSGVAHMAEDEACNSDEHAGELVYGGGNQV